MKVETNFESFKKLDKELMWAKSHIIVLGVLSEDFVDGVSVKEYAIYNEYGTIFIPARPFFRTATQSRKARRIIDEYIEKQADKVIDSMGDFTMKQAYNAIGLYVVGLVQKNIRNGNWQSNSQATIDKKGKNNPLIATGTLIESISYEIRRI